MKRALVAGGLILGFALLAAPAQAQTGTVRGHVFDEQGQPLPEAKVKIEFQGGMTRNFEVKTNKKGDFTQVGLPPGNYRITASKEGYQPSAVSVRVALGEPTQVPELKLVKGGAPSPDETANIKAIFQKAFDLRKAGKLDEAEAAYKEVLAKRPDVPEVHLNLGLLSAEKKDWASAEAAYLKALELRPDYTDAAVELARVYKETGQAGKAMELISKTASQSPQDAKAQYSLAIYLLNENKSEEAIAALQKTIAADPTMAEAYFHLGTQLINQNKMPEAIENLEKYLSMNPQNAQYVANAQALVAALKKKP